MLTQLEFAALLEVVRRAPLTAAESVGMNLILEKLKPPEPERPKVELPQNGAKETA